MPTPPWPGGSWEFAAPRGRTSTDDDASFAPYGLRVGMAFQPTREGIKPCGDFGGPIALGQIITIKKILYTDDSGVILHFNEVKGCLVLDEPCSSAFVGRVTRFLEDLSYIAPETKP